VSHPNTEAPPSPEPTPTFWQRRVVAPVLQQLTQGITPEKIALTLAVGTAFAFFPILGTTTLLCLIVGIMLRLNQPLIQLVNALCTLPHLLVIYGLVRLGGFFFGVQPTHANATEFIFRSPHSHFNILMILGIFGKAHRPFWHRVEVDALHAIVAWLVLAPFWIATVYWSSVPVLRDVARTRAESAMKMLEIKPPDHPVP
jgi:uncharacterized protein (DUF2062 family)